MSESGQTESTDSPETDSPETNAPETNAPETNAPETNVPETNAPETNPPETELPSAHTHSYTQTVTAPTCTEGGYTDNKCACGDEYRSDITDAVGHSYIDGVCAACGSSNESYKTFDSGRWYAEVVSGDCAMQYWLDLTQKDSFGSETEGYPITQRGGRRFELLSDEEKAFAEEYSLIFEVENVKYAYSDENDGMELIDFTVDGNKITLIGWYWGENGEELISVPCIVLERTAPDAFTVSEILNSDKSTYLHRSLPIGAVLTFVGE